MSATAVRRQMMISIHSPHARGDGGRIGRYADYKISIHSPHARGDSLNVIKSIHVLISIHSPHARGDQTRFLQAAETSDFNPLPSCEGRLYNALLLVWYNQFQSTPLMRGETRAALEAGVIQYISIHSPHARGDDGRKVPIMTFGISIHSPHARGDPKIARLACTLPNFNPLPSCEGRQHKLPKNPSNSRQFIQHNSFYMIS